MNKGLTWQDIKRIILIEEQMVDEDIQGKLPYLATISEEDYYKEVLKRFNND